MNSDIDYRDIALQKAVMVRPICQNTYFLLRMFGEVENVSLNTQQSIIGKRACNVPTHIVMLLIINDSLFNCCIS